MIIDGLLKLSDKQTITATAVSANTIDRGVDSGRLFGGREVIACVMRDGTKTAADSVTLTASIQTSADNSTWKTVYTGATIKGSAFEPGTLVLEAFPVPSYSADRYVRVNYTVEGSASVVVDAFVCVDATPFVDHEFKTKA